MDLYKNTPEPPLKPRKSDGAIEVVGTAAAGFGCISGGMILAFLVYACLLTDGTDRSAREDWSTGLKALALLIGLVGSAVYWIVKAVRNDLKKPPKRPS